LPYLKKYRNFAAFFQSDMETPQKFIDIREVIRAKNPALLRLLPPFVLGGMKRLIHQDEINRIIYDYRHLQGLAFVRAVLADMRVSYTAEGLEQLPSDRRYIFAANHPLGGFDGLVLMDAIGAAFPNVRFLVNDLLLNLRNFDPLFVPINKHGRQSAAYAQRIAEAYGGDCQVLNFPAGLCSRKHGKVIADLPWRGNFIRKAVSYRRDVAPVYFDGRNSGFFYGLANLRKALGVKANIEMTFLVNEFFKQQGRHVLIRFGQPIPYTHFDASKTPEQWAAEVREQVYAMRPE
jgi:putative hemolysin